VNDYAICIGKFFKAVRNNGRFQLVWLCDFPEQEKKRKRSVFIIIASYFLLFILFSVRTGLAKGMSEMTNLVMLR
jgi:hypothetical protein